MCNTRVLELDQLDPMGSPLSLETCAAPRISGSTSMQVSRGRFDLELGMCMHRALDSTYFHVCENDTGPICVLLDWRNVPIVSQGRATLA